MVKRGIALLSALIMLCMCGCTGGQADDTAINTTETDAPEQTGQAAENETDGQNTAETFPILGLIIDDDGSDSARLPRYCAQRPGMKLLRRWTRQRPKVLRPL